MQGESRHPEKAEKQRLMLQDKLLQILQQADYAPSDRAGLAANIQEIHSEAFQGPVPHPKHAEAYENICPGFLERSLAIAEKAQTANIENSRLALENERLEQINIGKNIDRQAARDRLDSRDTARGQYLGFAALIVLVAAAFVSMLLGHEKIAMIFVGAGVLGVIGKFLAGKFSSAGHETKD